MKEVVVVLSYRRHEEWVVAEITVISPQEPALRWAQRNPDFVHQKIVLCLLSPLFSFRHTSHFSSFKR